MPAAAAEGNGKNWRDPSRKSEIIEQWGEMHLVLREPVVPTSVVENAKKAAAAGHQGGEGGPWPLREDIYDDADDDADDGEEASASEGGDGKKPQPPSFTDKELGLDLFTVTGSPAPKLRWVDQDKLRIEFAPGTSPNTPYAITFKPQVGYLGGAPLETREFPFRMKPAELRAHFLPDYAGGAALLTAVHLDTLEAQRLVKEHGGLKLCFRRMRHIPLVGDVCTGTVAATIRPATVAEGLCYGAHPDLLRLLMKQHKPESIRRDTVLPQCLLVLPAEPLVGGAEYELGIEAAPNAGFKAGELPLGHMGTGLATRLSTEMVQQGDAPDSPYVTRLKLSFSYPVPQEQVKALWNQLGIRALSAADGGSARGRCDESAALQADGSYRVEWRPRGLAGLRKHMPHATLRLHGLLPCEDSEHYFWRHGGREQDYRYAPAGCVMGMEIDVETLEPVELEFTLPPIVTAPHGAGMGKKPHVLCAGIMPACPVLTGNGCNELPLSGSHRLRLPAVNVMGVRATAYHWSAEDAARLLPLIQRGMRDDTPMVELLHTLDMLRRRADEGLSTSGGREDLRTTAGRAIRLLKKEWEQKEPLRRRALAAATAFPTQHLVMEGRKGSSALVQKGDYLLDLDALTGGQVRPGLYLVSLTAQPNLDVEQAIAHYRREAGEKVEAPLCTVDYLVQVTDISARVIADRLMVGAMLSGEPLGGVSATGYVLPEVKSREDEEDEGADLTAEAKPARQHFNEEQGRVAPAPEPLALAQGQAAIPLGWEKQLLLLRRGEDYRLVSLAGTYLNTIGSMRAGVEPAMEAFTDRPLYRPGEVAHLRGVLRHAAGFKLGLPRAKEVELTFRKPNDEVVEVRKAALDAYGAFTADFTLPAGEEDVTGNYTCLCSVKEHGHTVERTLRIPCEVFRRDAFKAKATLELDPVAPEQYRVSVQATDYNGTPLAGGKLVLKLFSTAPLSGEGVTHTPGHFPTDSGLYKLERTLMLDGGGRAECSGTLGKATKAGAFTVEGSVSNDREEHVVLHREQKPFSPADFLIISEAGERVRLTDARTEKPLARAQELTLRFTIEEDRRVELPCGLYRMEKGERELSAKTITVPADCAQGLDLSEAIRAATKDRDGSRSLKLVLTGKDPEGRSLRYERTIWGTLSDKSDGRSNYGQLHAEERTLTLEAPEPFARSGKLHAFISSQGRLRHTLAEARAGERTLTLPLAEGEFGEVAVTAATCGKDAWGNYRDWQTVSARCRVARPDKELHIEFTLPQGAKPGEAVRLQGCVKDAQGQPAKAAVTLFAVDAGMMSVAPYTLPDMAAEFYRGSAGTLELSHPQTALSAQQAPVLTMPQVWSGEDWDKAPAAESRSVYPLSLRTEALESGIGSLCHQRVWRVVHAARLSFSLSELFDITQQYQYAPAPAPEAVAVPCVAEGPAGYGSVTNGLMTGGLRSGSGALQSAKLKKAAYMKAADSFRAKALAEVDSLWEEDLPPWLLEEGGDEDDACTEEDEDCEEGEGAAPMPRPRLRQNFAPVAVWLASVETGADGSFSTDATLPDTLTTYRVFAVALGAGGDSFGKAEGEFVVNQPLMLTAGTPFFMSTGDRLLLPLTVTNNTDEAGTWKVTLSGAKNEPAPQQVELAAKGTATLFFEVVAGEEGEAVLQWTAMAQGSADAVEGKFPVRYPAPVLKEAHRFVLTAGEGGQSVNVAEKLAAEVAGATRGEIEVQYSTSPLLHAAGSIDFLVGYPYGCTEQRASALLPWLFYDRLAPFCPQMALTSPDKARKLVDESIAKILERQQKDGGLSYWAPEKGEEAESCAWASAYAALVLTIAKEQGFAVPEEALEKLRGYLAWKRWHKRDYLIQYAAARARGESSKVNRILVRALRRELEQWEGEGEDGDAVPLGFRGSNWELVNLEFLAELQSDPAGRHQSFLKWMRSQGHDYRHRTSWSGGWTIIALAEYLRLEPKAEGAASVCIDGEVKEAGNTPASVRFKVADGKAMRDIAPVVAAGQGTVYVAAKVKAQPEQTDYPGVTEKGLQVTRIYEVQDAEGKWQKAESFKVGDVVRVTLTCAKVKTDLEYFVLEDYLPSCMEAINPRVPGQAAGLPNGGWGVWSSCFDHKEYLADRVRGFCTRWSGRELINMSYYARVKRAGESMAAPAEAQLMYEPQTYGLSPNTRVRSE